MWLVDMLGRASQQPLDGCLPAGITEAMRRRAERLGRPRPRYAADVLDGAYADLLWTRVTRDSMPDPEDAWRTHLRAAVADFRRLVEALRGGESLIVFPEGEPSHDGAIGPLRGGLASLARRGRARLVQPIAIAYDPLTQGRTRAYVSVAPAFVPAEGLEQTVTEALRGATPLTAGQLAATVVRNNPDPSPLALVREAEQWLARAGLEGRPVAPSLAGDRRAAALREAFYQARRRGPQDPVVRRLALEHESAHGKEP
jgi:hypothetical protein